MKPANIIIYIITLIIGIAIGVFSASAFYKASKAKDKYAYKERHEGQYKHINPLLGCDLADDVLSDPELGGIKLKVKHIVNSGIKSRLAANVGVYFRELNDGYWFSIGETEKFVPASLRKVPLMIALLKQAESDKDLLDRLVTYDLSNDYNLNQNIKPSQTLVSGNRYSVRDLIFRMIVYSDNNAFTFLTKIVNPTDFDRVYSALRMQNPRDLKDDAFLSIQTYASFFRVLYNTSFLDRKESEWALDILAKSEFRTGLVAGVPPNIEISHKFGEKSDATEQTVQLHDCGIVYYPNHPYLLCIMSKGTRFDTLDDMIKDVSSVVFSEVDKQVKSNNQNK